MSDRAGIDAGIEGSLIRVESEWRDLRAELAALEERLSERERELAAIEAGMREFEAQYLKTVGRKYAELEEIEARMAELTGQIDEAYAGAWDGAADAMDDLSCGQTRFQPSERLKKLYREVARKFHPDLAADDEERAERHRLMIEVNRAYESGVEEELEALLSAEGREAGCEADGAGRSESALLARRIASVKRKIDEVERRIEEFTGSEMYRLRRRVESAKEAGWDLMADLVSQVERQIEKSRVRLFHLEGVLGELTVDGRSD